jgi:hypothetical protein
MIIVKYPMNMQVATGGSGLFGLFGSKAAAAAAPKTKSVEAWRHGFHGELFFVFNGD